MLAVLLGTARELGAAVVVTTHDPRIARELDVRWYMADGRLIRPEAGDGERPDRPPHGPAGFRRREDVIRIWLNGLLRRRGGRLLAVAAGVATAVALLAALGGFLGATHATMTAQSVRATVVDWQVQAANPADVPQVLNTVHHTPGTRAALPVGYASTSGLSATAGGTSQTTGPGSVLGLPPATVRRSPARSGCWPDAATGAAGPADRREPARGPRRHGGRRAGGAATGAGAGGRCGGSAARRCAVPEGRRTAAVPADRAPDNVVLLPQHRWHTAFDPLGKARPDLVHAQIHARRSHALPPDPALAYATATGRAHHTDLRLAGTGVVGDNLGTVLDAARSDALYAQLLFLFLGVPGAVLAGALTAAVAGAGAARRRRNSPCCGPGEPRPGGC
ncbi:hypothetical protein O1L68_00685 [Streptomyces lydicus]|nr:hypothetical protein [Streptomyces lydicus]